MPTSQKVQIDTFDFGPSLTAPTLGVLATGTTIANGTASTCNEQTADSGVYIAEFVGADASALIPAGTYRLRTAVSGLPLKRFVTFSGVDGELVYARSEEHAVLNSATIKRFVTEDTGETAAADGSVAKLAQGAGGAGGTDWTEEQREYILEQLALLTVSGASVVVTSGVYMCARGDVEQVYGNANTATWADLNNNQNSSEITSRINYHIAIADNYIRSVLTQGAWVMPVEGDTIPAILAYNCARLAGVLLYEGRGVSDYDSKGKPIHQLSHHKNGVDSFLKSVVYGSTDLSPLVKSSTNEAPTAS